MAVYYKFKSAKDYDSIAIDGHFITVGHLKEKIFESKHLGRGTDFDLVVTNAQTNEEYLDEAMMVPKNTSVLIRRVPGRPRMNIVTQPDEPMEENKPVEPEPAKSSYSGVDSAVMKYPDDTEWDEFGNDLYAIPEVLPIHSSNPIQDAAPPPSIADEDSKIRALIETPALDWQQQGPDGFGSGRGFGRGMGGRMMNGRGFGRLGLERKTPPQGYICHRCKVQGHFIQHCPTNGDPNYDIKRVKPPTGIPKSMLMATPDGSYALPTGQVAVLRPNEAAFDKEIEGLPSTRFVGDLPPEFHCPLCKEVMKDAVLTSKCCFTSFCDKCIRDYSMSKSMCVCGATNILADDLLPNKTLRDTISRILESNNSSAENAGSTYQVQDMESARCPQPKIPSPTLSAASKGESMPPPRIEEIPKMKETASEGRNTATAPQQTSDKGRIVKVADVSEATHDSMSVKEAASQGSAPLAEEEVQQKVASIEAGKKKKKKKIRPTLNAAEMQWMPSQDLAPENFMMPMGPGAYNPYWNGMQPGMDGYMAPYGGPMPYMGYAPGPLDMPFGNMMPHDPFGAQGYMMPLVPPQRDLAEFGMGLNAGPPIMSREEFEARKADLRRKRELERRGESREFTKDREFARREVSSGAEMKSKSILKSGPQTSTAEHHRHRSEKPLPERPSARELEQPPPRPPKRKSTTTSEHHHYYDDRDYHHDQHNNHVHHNHRSESSSARPSSETQPSKSSAAASASAAAAADRKHKASVFSRISFPEGEVLKKRKVVSSSSDGPGASVSSSHHHRAPASNGYPEFSTSVKAVTTGGTRKSGSSSVAVDYDYESSDEDRHFKRKPSRYEPSPPPPQPSEWEEEERRHSRSSRERERGREYERDRGGYSKHR